MLSCVQTRYLLQFSRLLSSADPSLFTGSQTGAFVQEQPSLGNQYLDDPILVKYLKYLLPIDVFDIIQEDLVEFGNSSSRAILKHHENVCNNEPILQQYNAWGRRVDDIIMHPSWRALHDVAAKEALVSIPYKKEFAEWSRLYQIAKLYLFSPSSGLYSCPLAMTDGAASILKVKTTEPFLNAFSRLTSNQPDSFWTSGQWMTEKRGGSDVGNSTETLAIRQADGSFKLYGYKWFTSATDANISLTLARIVDVDGKVQEGSKGLTMFYLETRKEDGVLNGIQIEKLKKKLGTRQMPTSELILDGTVAHQLSETGRGVASISPMLTITRIHNSLAAVGNMRRLLNLSKDFSKKRKAFGTLLCNLPLHVQTIARMEVEQRGGFFLLMKVAHLLGLVENDKATDQQTLLLRILTPLLKLYTGKQSISVASEGLESFGGYGYLEDTGLPVFLRDAQVLSIWEGTTNVLSLDVLRSITKTNGEVIKAYFYDVEKMLSSNPSAELQNCFKSLNSAKHNLQSFTLSAENKSEHFMMASARDFSYSLARLYIAGLLYEYAVKFPEDNIATNIAHRWASMQDLTPVVSNSPFYNTSSCSTDYKIAYGGK